MAQPTFPFPLLSLVTNANLKNIPATTLQKFYSLTTEDSDTFLFEFDILYHSFDYNIDAHKLKLFPATLKKSVVQWFMGLGANVVGTWDEMKILFWTNTKSIVRKMTQEEMISLEHQKMRMKHWKTTFNASCIYCRRTLIMY